ncbi:hypothetical protein KUW15_12945 [Qipengyuania aquimaris]|uniref:hypothetical protein n=1 Tax=Qipengyuania aquimaris TaxID=255984 RepID=UPI001C97F71A|nr:hypothetical protein [Qipengyuania aquimaris]MBY6129621.1 hypothetical protein [Qipengyuania aquimaris]
MNAVRIIALPVIAASLLASEPALADSEFTGSVSTRGVAAKRDILQNDEFDSSGFGADVSLRGEKDFNILRFWAKGSAGIFQYLDEERENRQVLQGEIGIARDFGEDLEISLRGVYSQNLVFVEALSADQQRARAQVKWEADGNRFQAYGEYRKRQYDQLVPADGTGTRFGGHYNRRLGSYHWVRVGGFADTIDSTDDERDYNRISGSVEYSHPVSRMFRGRASVDVRTWKFPGRIARGDVTGATRQDNAITPQVGVDYGRATGLFGRARAGYEMRKSNDERFDGNTPRLSLEVGYRF